MADTAGGGLDRRAEGCGGPLVVGCIQKGNTMAIDTFTALMRSMEQAGVPEHDRDGLALYVLRGVVPGSFLEAVLTNDLRGTFERADTVNAQHVREIVHWLRNSVENGAWGSVRNVDEWSARGGRLGVTDANDRPGVILGQGDYQRDICV